MGLFSNPKTEVVEPVKEVWYDVTLYMGNGLTGSLSMANSALEDLIDKMERGVSAGALRTHEQSGTKFAFSYKEIKAIKAIPKETND